MKLDFRKETMSNQVIEVKNDKEEPQVLEEIIIEELNVDGICGVY